MNTTELYTQWLEKATADPDLQAELQAIAGQDEEIRDRFYRSLEFGTAGLRGVIGAGTNRMNVYTVGRATQGLADYLNAKYDHPSVAIGYDSRIKSDLFSKEAAAVLAVFIGLARRRIDHANQTGCGSRTDAGLVAPVFDAATASACKP